MYLHLNLPVSGNELVIYWPFTTYHTKQMAAPYGKKMFDIELADKTDNIVLLVTRQNNETLVLVTLIVLSVGMISVNLWYICAELN